LGLSLNAIIIQTSSLIFSLSNAFMVITSHLP
jgi:hypothetical protein